jgi:hypothetical protein
MSISPHARLKKQENSKSCFVCQRQVCDKFACRNEFCSTDSFCRRCQTIATARLDVEHKQRQKQKEEADYKKACTLHVTRLDCDRVELLQLLKTLFYPKKRPHPSDYGGDSSRAACLAALTRQNGYVDYFCGVPIKANLNLNTIDLSLYFRDRLYGPYSAHVTELRALVSSVKKP